MGLFRGIKDTYKKSEAAVIVQNLLEHQVSIGTFDDDPAKLANQLVGKVWESLPDVFGGKFGQRPHKISVAATSLVHGIETLDKQSPSRAGLVFSLGALLNEVNTNGSFYPFNSTDLRLLNMSAEIFSEEASRYDKENGNLLGEAESFLKGSSRYDTSQQTIEDELSAEDYFEKGTQLAQALEYKKARKAFKKAAKLGFIEAYRQVARMCGRLNEDKDAFKWYKKAVKAGDNQSLSSFAHCLTLGYGCNQDLNKAESLYKQALELWPEDSAVLNELGYLYELKKDYPRALYNYQKAVDTETEPFLVELYEEAVVALKEKRASLEEL